MIHKFKINFRAMKGLVIFLLATIFLATIPHGSPQELADQIIHFLRPKFGGAARHVEGLSCLSWRLGVEVHNVIDWSVVPEECEGYIGHYMLGDQYRKDSAEVVHQAILYAGGLNLTGDGKDVWVFDVDETTLSNLPYYAKHGFGAEVYNSTSFNAWVEEGIAPALPESLKLYNKLLSLGIKTVLLTGRTLDQKSVTVSNLNNVGYYNWTQIILKNSTKYSGDTAVVYKSTEREKLVESGYRIVGNIGDQWSDILGTHTGNRTFKLPDPMYYIG